MRGRLRTLVGIAVSVLLLAWALRDVSFAVVVAEIRAADPVLFVLSIALTLVGFAFRAVRWGIVLRPMNQRVAYRPRFAATIIGFAANNLLPARVGEFARAFSLARLTPVSLVAAIATLVIERILDGLVLVGLLFAAMAAASFPVVGAVGGVDLRSAAQVLALLMGGVGLGLGVMVVAPDRSVRFAEWFVARVLPPALRRPVIAALHAFIEGLAVLRHGRLFLLSLVLAAAQWAVTAVSYLLGFRAFGIDAVDYVGAVFLQSFVSLAVAVPSSPGFFGPFEAAAKVGLSLWGVGADKAVSFAVGYHLGGFLPVTLMGIYYVWRLNLSWSEVRRSEEQATDPAAPPEAALRGKG